jgi:hypothetical protein
MAAPPRAKLMLPVYDDLHRRGHRYTVHEARARLMRHILSVAALSRGEAPHGA